ncbi:hypothetical protein E2562_024744 [Oryza meyeriana var. granulata]|uniref:F-box domain-containing protein n=1 Tax=Oryza meyeriana var. granulata TaxID=110450 RepID=A0A6G1D7F8_9ORYZ|nr:hypothetical protein E2562_024744 [Oryza meyeriana var. granulata]
MHDRAHASMDSGDGRRRRRRRGQCGGASPTTDRISALPDDLLHSILVGLGCVCAAARTSVLSRRWRRVWATMTELHFGWMRPPTSAAVLVDLTDVYLDTGFRAAHVAPWLHFAAQRVAGEISIRLRSYPRGCPEEQLNLPVCGVARKIILRLCPRLEELYLIDMTLVAASDVTVYSASLRRLYFGIRDTRRLDVAAPELRFLCVSHAVEAYITAAKVEEVVHTDDMDRYEYKPDGAPSPAAGDRLHHSNGGVYPAVGHRRRAEPSSCNSIGAK